MEKKLLTKEDDNVQRENFGGLVDVGAPQGSVFGPLIFYMHQLSTGLWTGAV